MKTFNELCKFPTFEERFEYLKLDSIVGKETFGFERYFNQKFYKSKEWRSIRNTIIYRDQGCDLGDSDHPILGKIIIHHMNPITIDDINSLSEYILDPEYLICVSHNTHNAIHYGSSDLLAKQIIDRKPFDTCPWKTPK